MNKEEPISTVAKSSYALVTEGVEYDNFQGELHWEKEQWLDADGKEELGNTTWTLVHGISNGIPLCGFIIGEKITDEEVLEERKKREHQFLIGELTDWQNKECMERSTYTVPTVEEITRVMGLAPRPPSPCCTKGFTDLYPKACWLWDAHEDVWILYDGDRVHTDYPVQDEEGKGLVELKFLAGVQGEQT